jgi:uncharacterized protein YabE (DUF348 family)
MNNLFSTRSAKKNLFTKAYVTVTSQEIIRSILTTNFPELAKLNSEQSFNIFIKQNSSIFEVSLYSQNTHVLTLLKLNLIKLQTEIAESLIDKKLLLDYASLKLKVYFK